MTVDDLETRLRATYRRVLACVPDEPPALGAPRRRSPWLRRRGVAAVLAPVLAAILVATALVAGGGRRSTAVNVAGTGDRTVTVRAVRGGTIGLPGSAQAVSCVSATWCVAVGTTLLRDPTPGVNGGRYYRGVHDLFTGGAWRPMPAGDLADLAGRLIGVSCVSVRWCVAVGEADGAGAQRTLVETWDGQRWSRSASPNSPDLVNGLLAVSCAGRHFCIAVGYQLAVNDRVRNLAEVFNGQRWALLPPANAEAAALFSVSCPSTNWCMAVGDASASTNPFNEASPDFPTAQRYMNGRWALLTVPVRGHSGAKLTGVACVTAQHCTAVGTNGFVHTLTEQYLAGHWTAEVASGPPRSDLASVACQAGRCVAIGTVHYRRGSRPLIEVIGGGLTKLTPSMRIYAMASISCPTSRICIAVGGNTHRTPFTAALYLRIIVAAP
ncbi:MAG: hypothetical protein ACYCUG_05995 [Acidimicrobiales bacterium]